MKKLIGALVLSSSLLLTSGCRSSGETKSGEDASTSSEQNPSPAGAIDATKGALSGDEAGGSTGAAQPAPGVNLEGMKSDSGTGSSVAEDPAAATPASKGSGEGTTAMPLSEEVRAAQEACLDKWLNSKKMDRYGHPEGTMYTGGTPLFNEATGESRDRLDYVYQRQPEAKKACANAGAKKAAPAPKQ